MPKMWNMMPDTLLISHYMLRMKDTILKELIKALYNYGTYLLKIL